MAAQIMPDQRSKLISTRKNAIYRHVLKSGKNGKVGRNVQNIVKVERVLVQENVTANVGMEIITKRLKNATSNPVQSGQHGVNRHRAILKVANLQVWGLP